MEKLQVVRELHKPARRNFPRRRVIIRGLHDLMQADLADFQKFSKQNKGHKYILVAIDCFSKFLWTAPLKNKTGKEVTAAMKKIFNEELPKNLQVDDGGEFWNKQFQDLCEKNSVNMYSTFSPIKASIAERVIRTLKSKLYFEFSVRGKYVWIDILNNVTKQYNETVHRTIGMRPIDARKKKNEKHLLKSAYTHIKIFGNGKFKVGDVVRISKYKSIFDKGYHSNWSTELFTVRKIQITNPVTYLLSDMDGQDISGAFYEQELQKAKYSDVYLLERVLRKKGRKVYVKFLGLKKNTWIDSKDLL